MTDIKKFSHWVKRNILLLFAAWLIIGGMYALLTSNLWAVVLNYFAAFNCFILHEVLTIKEELRENFKRERNSK